MYVGGGTAFFYIRILTDIIGKHFIEHIIKQGAVRTFSGLPQRIEYD
jgi:hypothetical protein